VVRLRPIPVFTVISLDVTPAILLTQGLFGKLDKFTSEGRYGDLPSMMIKCAMLTINKTIHKDLMKRGNYRPFWPSL
jgi:hypothetical protein